MDNALVPLEERVKHAQLLAEADLLPEQYRKKPANILLVQEAAEHLGISMFAATQQITIIKGRPTMSAELMRALVLKQGHRFTVVESTADVCRVAVARKEWPDDVSTFAFTMADADAAGLSKSPTYQRHPKAMLLARVTTQACRAVFADAIAGISYDAEELAPVVDVLPSIPLAVDTGTGEIAPNDA